MMLLSLKRFLPAIGLTFLLGTMFTISYYNTTSSSHLPAAPVSHKLLITKIDHSDLIRLSQLAPGRVRFVQLVPSVSQSSHPLPSSASSSSSSSSSSPAAAAAAASSAAATATASASPLVSLPHGYVAAASSASSTVSSTPILSSVSVATSSTSMLSSASGTGSGTSGGSGSGTGSSSGTNGGSGVAESPPTSSFSPRLNLTTPSEDNSVAASAALAAPRGLDGSTSGSSQEATSTVILENRTYTFRASDLQTIGNFTIDKPNYCDTDNGATLDLLIIVASAVGNFAARRAIRQTWGQFAVERGALLLFLVGESPNPSVTARIRAENAAHDDILQASFHDSYYNLTLKTLSMMSWIYSNCDKVKFVLKVDDDMFVNMQLLVDFAETRKFNRAIIGHIAKKWRPHRNLSSKWYVPPEVFNRTMYPNFATGPAYMFSGDAVGPLLDAALHLTPIYLEDVFLTGIVAEKAGIRRLNYSLMKNIHLQVTHCNFKRFITSHKHSPAELVQLWDWVYSEHPDKPCDKPASSAGSSSTGAKISHLKAAMKASAMAQQAAAVVGAASVSAKKS